MRADQHAIATAAIDFLDHEFGEVIEDIAQRLGLAAAPGRHILQYRFFAGIEAHDFGHVAVDRLVIGNAGADGIGERDIAGMIGRHQPRHAEHRGWVEDQRIDEGIVEAPVDDVHPFRALRRPHENHIVTHEQIGALDELDAELVGEEAMFVKGAVVPARCQQHADRRTAADAGARADRGQRFEQCLRVGFHRRNLDLVEQFGDQLEHHLAVFEHVRHPRRGAGIVFEHIEFMRAGADKVDPGDVRPDAAGRLAAHHLEAIARVL